MRVMALSFLGGLLFVRWWRDAWWIVLMMVATLLLLIVGKIVAPDLSRSVIGSVVHLLLWPLALAAVWSRGARSRRSSGPVQGFGLRAFQLWLIWVSALIAVSLLLDARYLILQYGSSHF
jgi:hypothetical protein